MTAPNHIQVSCHFSYRKDCFQIQRHHKILVNQANQDLERLRKIANDQLFRAEYCASATGLTCPQAPLNCVTSGKSGKQGAWCFMFDQSTPTALKLTREVCRRGSQLGILLKLTTNHKLVTGKLEAERNTQKSLLFFTVVI